MGLVFMAGRRPTRGTGQAVFGKQHIYKSEYDDVLCSCLARPRLLASACLPFFVTAGNQGRL
jgi:hypothetical protein